MSGAASLLDFLNAQADYRSVQVNYLNLVAAYLDGRQPVESWQWDARLSNDANELGNHSPFI